MAIKKIIAASVLPLLFLSVGSTNASAEFAMYDGREEVEPKECEDAAIKGFKVKEEQNEHFSMGKETSSWDGAHHIVYDEHLYELYFVKLNEDGFYVDCYKSYYIERDSVIQPYDQTSYLLNNEYASKIIELLNLLLMTL